MSKFNIQDLAELYGMLSDIEPMPPETVIGAIDAETSEIRSTYVEDCKRVGHELIDAGIPVLIMKRNRFIDHRGHEIDEAYHFPKWGHIDPQQVEAMAELHDSIDHMDDDDALVMLTGFGLDAIDIDEKDNGVSGEESWARWTQANEMPVIIGEARTANGGRHLLVNSTGRGNGRAGVIAPGVDYRGKGGALYIGPSIKATTTGELGAYVWTTEPNIEEINPKDTSTVALAYTLDAASTSTPADLDREALPFDGPLYVELTDAQRSVADKYLATMTTRLGAELADLLALPEGASMPWGREGRPARWNEALGMYVVPRILQAEMTPWHPWQPGEGIAWLLSLSDDADWQRLVRGYARTKRKEAERRGAIERPNALRGVIRVLGISSPMRPGRPARLKPRRPHRPARPKFNRGRWA